MKTNLLLIILLHICACNPQSKENSAGHSDSTVNKEMQAVDEMLKNEDSLMKAKEKELLEKYSR